MDVRERTTLDLLGSLLNYIHTYMVRLIELATKSVTTM